MSQPVKAMATIQPTKTRTDRIFVSELLDQGWQIKKCIFRRGREKLVSPELWARRQYPADDCLETGNCQMTRRKFRYRIVKVLPKDYSIYTLTLPNTYYIRGEDPNLRIVY